MLRKSKPSTISAFGKKRPILLFTDGCWENKHAGLGAVTFDTATGEGKIFSGAVPEALLKRWERLVGEQLICQIELYAMVALRWMLTGTLINRRTIWWVDNDAARFSVIKGQCPSPVMRWLVRKFYNFEVEAPTFSWVERVPSYSNIADGPSRAKPEEAMRLLSISICLDLDHPPELVACLLNT